MFPVFLKRTFTWQGFLEIAPYFSWEYFQKKLRRKVCCFLYHRFLKKYFFKNDKDPFSIACIGFSEEMESFFLDIMQKDRAETNTYWFISKNEEKLDNMELQSRKFSLQRLFYYTDVTDKNTYHFVRDVLGRKENKRLYFFEGQEVREQYSNCFKEMLVENDFLWVSSSNGNLKDTTRFFMQKNYQVIGKGWVANKWQIILKKN